MCEVLRGNTWLFPKSFKKTENIFSEDLFDPAKKGFTDQYPARSRASVSNAVFIGWFSTKPTRFDTYFHIVGRITISFSEKPSFFVHRDLHPNLCADSSLLLRWTVPVNNHH